MAAPAVETAREDARAGRLDAAERGLRKYLGVKPRDAEALIVLAMVLHRRGDAVGAVATAERALACGGGHAALSARAQVYESLGRDDDAIRDRRAIRDASGDPSSLLALTDCLVRVGRAEEAAHELRDAIAHAGDDPDLLHALVFVLNVAGTASPGEEREWHRRLARAASRGAARAAPFQNTREPERRLLVAILSSDLRLHSCAFFLEGWLGRLDPARVALHLYSTTREPDAVSERFRTMGVWRDVGACSERQLADAARADAIDVLVDANGWTVRSQMRALASRLAPVQVSYLGYPNTTGLDSMDARVVDATCDPAGSEEACTERLVRMEGCAWCFAPDPAWPAPAPRPDGPVTFGSFNHGAKITPAVVRAWADILRRVPGSRLVLKSPAGSAVEARWRRRFGDHGIAPDRIAVMGFVEDTGAHVAQYAAVDVALDPFPYNGTTTTCEALWMGVPVVTLAGDRHRARVGASLLHAVGLDELVTAGVDAYVRAAAALALDGDRRGDLRRTLRQRMAASALCDGAGYAARFESALRDAWRHWCAAPAA